MRLLFCVIGPVAVTQWVINYFSPKDSGKPSNAFAAINGASPIIVSERMPLILQVLHLLVFICIFIE